MFYIKGDIGGKKVHVNITDENVYTSCVGCGKELPVDLVEILQNDGDLYGTQIYCRDCVRRQTERNK